MLRFEPSGGALLSDPAREISLPEDLPPGGQLNVVIPADRLPAQWVKMRIRIMPTIAGVGEREVAPERADLKLSIEERSTEIARSPSKSSAPKR